MAADVTGGPRRNNWWTNSISVVTKDKNRMVAALLIYTIWNLWKERNRKIFEGARCSPLKVFNFIRKEVALRQMACGALMIE
ncbi:hypothetical protein SETIT_9G452100v2 [Setaria italica]|uniref:Uncharacterized protein n=1 Tax=Setaria italica TaxID=4555 RepID=A0A368SSQ8_SETIT|nr:hypothetical protein SETIT_9G452100v2 [Setaria italica]